MDISNYLVVVYRLPCQALDLLLFRPERKNYVSETSVKYTLSNTATIHSIRDNEKQISTSPKVRSELAFWPLKPREWNSSISLSERPRQSRKRYYSASKSIAFQKSEKYHYWSDAPQDYRIALPNQIVHFKSPLISG